jgi:Helix-turn-helix domain
MKEREQKTTEDGGLHAFRTEIPNTVIRGLRSRDLSVHAKWLYVYFKSVCGDTRECYRTTSTISAESGISRAMVSTAKRELVKRGLITVTKARNPNRQPDHVIIKNIWVENVQEFSVLLANTGVLLANADDEAKEEENSHEEVVSVPLENAEDEERSISERSVLLANTGVLLANQRRSQEEDPLKKEKDKNPLPLGEAARAAEGKTAEPEKVKPEYSAKFLQFWDVYPIKREKDAAYKRWQTKKCEAIAGTVISSVQNHIKHDEKWHEGFIPYPAKFLSGGGWKDELADAKQAPSPAPAIVHNRPYMG